MSEINDMPPLDAKSRELVERMLAGDRRALARLMTLIESRPPEIYAIMANVSAHVRGAPRPPVWTPAKPTKPT